MTLKEIAAVSGTSGLFRVVGPARSGFLMETLDEKKSRSVTPASGKVSVLEEISIFTTTAEGTEPLAGVLVRIKGLFGDALPVTHDSAPEELRAFMSKVLPEHDERRVYQSDIRKLVRWYGILTRFAPEVLEAKAADTTEPQS